MGLRHSYEKRTRWGDNMADKIALKFHFHNPNTLEVTAEHLLAVLIKANAKKVEDAIREESDQCSNKTKQKRLVG